MLFKRYRYSETQRETRRMEQVEQESGNKVKGREEHPRVRFARRELVKVLAALERIDGYELSAAIRLEELEEELADAREEARRWRRGLEAMQALLECAFGTEEAERVKLLDGAIREWASRV